MNNFLAVVGLTAFLFCFLNFSTASPLTNSTQCGAITPIYWINGGTTLTNTLNFAAPMAAYFYGLPVFFGCLPVSGTNEGGDLAFEYYAAQYHYLLADYDSYDEDTKRRMMMDNNSTRYLVTSTVSGNPELASLENTYHILRDGALIDRTYGALAATGQNITVKNTFDNQNRVNQTKYRLEGPDSLISASETTKTTRQQTTIPLISKVLSLKHFSQEEAQTTTTYAYYDQQLPEQESRSTFSVRGEPSQAYTRSTKFQTLEVGLISQINITTNQNGQKTKAVTDITYDGSQVTSLCTDGNCETYKYDQQGRLVAIEADGNDILAEFKYNEKGQLVTANLGSALGNWVFQY